MWCRNLLISYREQIISLCTWLIDWGLQFFSSAQRQWSGWRVPFASSNRPFPWKTGAQLTAGPVHALHFIKSPTADPVAPPSATPLLLLALSPCVWLWIRFASAFRFVFLRCAGSATCWIIIILTEPYCCFAYRVMFWMRIHPHPPENDVVSFAVFMHLYSVCVCVGI